MINHLRRFFIVNMALILALVGSGVFLPSMQAQASRGAAEYVRISPVRRQSLHIDGIYWQPTNTSG